MLHYNAILPDPATVIITCKDIGQHALTCLYDQQLSKSEFSKKKI
jgi:hypothetical protein